MKKIRKLEEIELTSQEQNELYGGCSCSGTSTNFSNPNCCGSEENEASMYCRGSYPPTGGGDRDDESEEGDNSCTCGNHCMPGDNVEWSNWVGTKYSTSWWG